MPAHALADSRLSAEITYKQFGSTREKARLVVREGERLLAAREIVLKPKELRRPKRWCSMPAWPDRGLFSSPSNPYLARRICKNNQLTRLVNVTSSKARILYFEGRAALGVQVYSPRARG